MKGKRTATPHPLPLGFFAAIYHAGGQPDPACKAGIERYFAAKSATPAQITVRSENGASLDLFLSQGCRVSETDANGCFTCSFPSNERIDAGGAEARDEPVPGRFYTFAFSKKTGELKLRLDEFTPLQAWHARFGGTVVVSNDLRCFRHIGNPSLDETALRLLLAYLSLPPLMSVIDGVHSVPALHTLKLSPDSLEPKFIPHPMKHFPELQEETSIADCARAFTTEMDTAISRMLNAQVNYVCFSGGIDSAYLAWRLRELGAKCHLVLYAFEAGGRAVRDAQSMADTLGFPMTVIDGADRDDGKMLAGISQYYEFPFGDLGTLVSLHLAQGLARLAPSSALAWDGTAADALLMMAYNDPHWRRLYRIPLPLRRIAAWLYERAAWSRPGRAEYALRTVWRTVHLRYPYSICMAKTPPSDLALKITDTERYQMIDLCESHIMNLFMPQFSMAHKRSILGIFHRSAQVSTKGASALRQLGLLPVYPFMHREPLGASLSIPPEVKYQNAHRKPILTHDMESFFGPELLYQPKSGFAPRKGSLLEAPELIAALGDELNSATNPLNHLCDKNVMQRAFAVVRRGVGTDTQIHKSLWTYLFTSLWLRGTAP